MADKQVKGISRKGVRGIIIVFVIVALAVGIMDSWGRISPKILGNDLPVNEGGQSGLAVFRNKRIDAMKPEISREKDSVYSDEDVTSAIECVKQYFKKQGHYCAPTKISFEEKECNAFRDGYHAYKDYGEKNMIVIMCNFNVFKDYGDLSRMHYTGWSMIFARENQDSEWKMIDQGY